MLQSAYGLCRNDELQELYKVVCGSKYQGKSQKEEIIQSLKKHIETQRNYFGKSLKETFCSIAMKFFRKQENEEDIYLPHFRLVPNAAILLRRTQRLYQMTASLPSGSAMVSAHEPVEFYAPLMSMLKVVTYPPYMLYTSSAQSVQPASPSVLSPPPPPQPLFACRREFVQWEGGVELRVAYEHAEHGGKGEDTYAIIEREASKFSANLFSDVFLSPASSLSDFLSNYIKSRNASRETEPLLPFLLTATLSLLSVELEHQGIQPPSSLSHLLPALTGSSSSSGTLPSTSTATLEDYKIRYRPGASLCSLVEGFASYLEKEQTRDYVLALLLYELLLSLPYREHKRGLWYVRMVVNLSHLKLLGLAVGVVKRGLEDSHLQLSDELDLQDRLRTLTKRTAPKPEKKSKSRDVSGEVDYGVGRMDGDAVIVQQWLNSLDAVRHTPRHLYLLSACILTRLEQRALNSECGINNRKDVISSSHLIEVTNKSVWSCEICTYINKFHLSGCEMCGNAKVTKRADKCVEQVIDLLSDNEDKVCEVVEESMGVETEQNRAGSDNQFNYPAILSTILQEVHGNGCKGNESPGDPNVVNMVEEEDNSDKKEGLDLMNRCKEIAISMNMTNPVHAPEIVRCFIVASKRFGAGGGGSNSNTNSKPRVGKSRFVGAREGELLSVEKLVMEKCRYIDEDEHSMDGDWEDVEGEAGGITREVTSRHSTKGVRKGKKTDASEDSIDAGYSFVTIPYRHAIQEGGWVGWHCEGGILRTLCGLLMWDVFFAPQSSPVFLSPFQDGPLDYPYPSFYLRRSSQIHEHITRISTMSPSALLDCLSHTYRTYFGTRCAVVSWGSYPLRALQLAALCIGTKGLAVLCGALYSSPRQLRSGAPDLFLVRVRRKNKCAGAQKTDILDLDELWGKDWSKPPPSTRIGSRKSNEEESWMLTSPSASPQRKRMKE
eukprot:gene30572-36945_t